MNCPSCGAVVKEGKFCNYCGAKLPDDTKRVEVKIEKRIEDIAEVKRAAYEEKESELRQKQMKRDLRKGKVKWTIIGILTLYGILNIVFKGPWLISLLLFVGIPAYIVATWLSKL